MKSDLSVVVTPRDGVHYQDLLYRRIEEMGVSVRFTIGPTSSQSLNIVLAPATLLWYRLRGARVLHIHWVFQFALPWARRKRWAMQLMESWFGLYLRTAQLLGYAIVWTAHDLIPHEQVFADDRRARDLLISKSDVVIALSGATADELLELGARDVRVIPIGSYAAPYPVALSKADARSRFGFEEDDLVVSLIGRIEEYKGADLLVMAVARLPGASKVKLLLAGLCSDDAYRSELIRLSKEAAGRTVMRFEWIPDEDLAQYMQATDVAVFPFREVSNSASISLAQSFGKPIIMTNLPSLRDIPSEAAIRFELGVDPLVDALQQVERLSPEQFAGMSEAGRAWASRADWTNIARETIDAYEAALTAK